MGKVKFYSINDLSVGFNLLNIEEKIKQYEDGKEPQDVSEFIEIYNIKQYFDNKIYRSNWSKEMITRYTGLVNNLYSKGATFFKSISDNNIIAICNIINEHNYRGYYQDFWKLIENFKVYEHISPEKFKEVISLPKFGLYNILINKNLVSHFG